MSTPDAGAPRPLDPLTPGPSAGAPVKPDNWLDPEGNSAARARVMRRVREIAYAGPGGGFLRLANETERAEADLDFYDSNGMAPLWPADPGQEDVRRLGAMAEALWRSRGPSLDSQAAPPALPSAGRWAMDYVDSARVYFGDLVEWACRCHRTAAEAAATAPEDRPATLPGLPLGDAARRGEPPASASASTATPAPSATAPAAPALVGRASSVLRRVWDALNAKGVRKRNYALLLASLIGAEGLLGPKDRDAAIARAYAGVDGKGSLAGVDSTARRQMKKYATDKLSELSGGELELVYCPRAGTLEVIARGVTPVPVPDPALPAAREGREAREKRA